MILCSNVRVHFRFTSFSHTVLGISVCQLYNMPPQDLLWKWEAIRFKGNSLLSASENPIFNMDSITAIKAQLTRELKEGSKRKPQARPNQLVFPANLQRSRFTSRSHVVKTEPSDVHLSGSAAVDFRGPRTDEASKKRRACELLSVSRLGFIDKRRQIGICTKR